VRGSSIDGVSFGGGAWRRPRAYGSSRGRPFFAKEPSLPPIAAALISFAFIAGAAVLGSILRAVLPRHHLSDESRSALKFGTGLIATLTALVLGLLVSSAKSSFDAINSGLAETGARVITLDRLLAHYGPAAAEARLHLKAAVAATIARAWPDEVPGAPEVAPLDEMSAVVDRIEDLPVNDVQQRAFQSQTLSMSTALTLSFWQLVERTRTPLPLRLLGILVFWLCVLFVEIGLFAPRNATVAAAVLLSAISVSAAILLILEMNVPLEGLIKVSSASLRAALDQIGR